MVVSIEDIMAVVERELCRERRARAVRVMVGAWDMELTLEAVTEEEVRQAYAFSDDGAEQDMYLLYMACPELRAVGRELTAKGLLSWEAGAARIFSAADRSALVRQVLDISGLGAEHSVKVLSEVEAIKKSQPAGPRPEATPG